MHCNTYTRLGKELSRGSIEREWARGSARLINRSVIIDLIGKTLERKSRDPGSIPGNVTFILSYVRQQVNLVPAVRLGETVLVGFVPSALSE